MTSKEKARLEEALSSESGQQQLAIRTYKTENTELEDEINKLEVRINAAPDENTDENEKMKQMEEQYQLVADKLQKQRLVMVKKQINSHFQTKTKTKSFIFL